MASGIGIETATQPSAALAASGSGEVVIGNWGVRTVHECVDFICRVT